jgi:uncharacterized DUF497 family protein
VGEVGQDSRPVDAKAEANLSAHGVSFELAKTVFKDPFAIELLDDREDYGEERFIIIGMAKGEIPNARSTFGSFQAAR